MGDKELLEAADIVFSPIEQSTVQVIPPTNNLEEIERNTIEQVVAKHKGNISRAAKELGITRAALYRRMDKYDL
jgi:transcriptional regulator with PAS, ATPase and Fis domain